MLKKSIALCLGCLLSQAVFAVFPGFYVGAIAGQTYTNYTASNVGLSSANVNNTGFGGGAFGGYQFDRNWSVELNFVEFTSTRMTNVNGVSGSTGRISENATELFGKGTWPVSDAGFNFTARAGIAFVKAISSGALSNQSNSPNMGRFLPAYSAGVSYDVTPSTPIEISWTQVINGSNIQDANLFGLSASYYFG